MQTSATFIRSSISPGTRKWVVLSALLWLATTLPAQPSVEIRIQERGGVARSAEGVCFGIPLPRAWGVADVSRLRLLDSGGQAIPAQFETLARWGGAPGDASAPVKWVLVAYQESLAAGAAKVVRLDAAGPGPPPQWPIQADDSIPGKLRIQTGGALFEINTAAGFNLIHQVFLGGQGLLVSLGATEAIRYGPAGADSIVPGGSPDFTPRVLSVALERSGPLYTVVRAEGSILDGGGRAILDFTARLHFWAGSARVRVDFTVENNQPVLAGGDGQPTNVHNQGAVNSVYVGDLELRLRLGGAGGPRVGTERNVQVNSPSAPVRLYQDSSGTESWDNYAGPVGWPGYELPSAPRLQSYCTLPGYRITGAGAPVDGGQALGWMWVARPEGAAPWVLGTVRDFWQNFPKAIQADPDGTLAVNLFPNGNQFRHNFRVGEEKTHTLFFHFGVGEVPGSDADRLAIADNHPLFGVAPAAWYVSSGALGEVPAADLSAWPLYERYVRIAFEPNPDFDPDIHDPSFGNTTLQEVIRRYNFFGWQDYGDVPIDYEPFGPTHAGQLNLKYWFVHGLLVQFCRSGEPRWLDLARPAAWHLADVDILHIPDEGSSHWSHGAYFGHSNHDEPGNLNPNRNSNSPSVDLFFGVPDLLLAYCLTGESRFREVPAEAVQSMRRMAEFSNFSHPIAQRERANLIFGYLEWYRHSGEISWLDDARAVIGPTADLAGKSWLTDPAGFGAANPGESLKTFGFCQTLWTMGRYLDFCQEYGLPDDLGVADALVAYSDFLLEHVMEEYEPGRAALVFEYFFDGSDPSYLDINNWALVMADALAYTAKHSGELAYLEAAELFYATGTIDPVWYDDPPVYLATKDLINSTGWGLVYMNRTLPPAFTSGDLNADGRINVTDLVILANHLAGHLDPGSAPFRAPLAAADMDLDGTVDSADLLVMARLLGGS